MNKTAYLGSILLLQKKRNPIMLAEISQAQAIVHQDLTLARAKQITHLLDGIYPFDIVLKPPSS